MKECIAEGTFVNISDNLSIPIEQLADNNSVYGINGILELSNYNQTDFMNKGYKKCIKLTLEDGRTITLTKNHNILTDKYNWIESGKLKVGDKLIVSNISTRRNYIQLLKETEGFSVSSLNTKNIKEIKKFSCFMKVLGFLFFKIYSNKWNILYI